MKHIWSVLCQKSSIDFENNQLSLFNCLEEINISLDGTNALKNNLVIPIEFQLVSYWSRQQADEKINLKAAGELFDANGKIINSFQNSFLIKSGIMRFRSRTNIQGLPITGPGQYHLRFYQLNIKNEREVVADLPIDVKINYKIMDIPKK